MAMEPGYRTQSMGRPILRGFVLAANRLSMRTSSAGSSMTSFQAICSWAMDTVEPSNVLTMKANRAPMMRLTCWPDTPPEKPHTW